MATIFWQFFLLGLTSFGGPAAHLGYFHRHFVVKKAWLSEQEYAQLIALSQFLPGPGSSQVGFAIGLQRGGKLGGIAAFLGFTLPSFLIMFALALVPTAGVPIVDHITSALKILAAIVVADAVVTMFSSFCKSTVHRITAIIAAIAVLFMPSLITQCAVILIAGMVGFASAQASQKVVLERVKPSYLVLFFLGFVSIFVVSVDILALFGQFYTAGALVFGGGHVVLPLLQQALPTVTTDQFLSAYASAQAVPGPMFTIATYLGAVAFPDAPLLGAVVATFAVFLPGFLLVLAFVSSWQSLAKHAKFAATAASINAAVVGLLLAAFYTPVLLSISTSWLAITIAFVGFILLRRFNIHIMFYVAGAVILGVLSYLTGTNLLH
ncbi:chromate efflux transporter [Thalassotalea agarivorans]|uniref:Chromate transporter n=1 Tax=Thalassotalea agarivorans TaxID=349064 RepID=A0A1I0CUW8_THASX|nr:chromate efflux transporter [Thalassotalea agarivorans]SET22896.1 chromate transporter [Thalassotalea agarivorans]